MPSAHPPTLERPARSPELPQQRTPTLTPALAPNVRPMPGPNDKPAARPESLWGARLKNLAEVAVRPRPPVGTTPADVVHRENKWSLLRYRRDTLPCFATPVLLVPSLINRHYVLDLLPGKSLAEWLVARGHDVFVIDWGTPGDEDRFVTFDDVCDRAIGRALRKTASFGARGKAHLLGYCLGGLLTVLHTAARPEHVASLLTLAAPVKFGADEGLLSAWTRTPTFDLDALVDATGNVPWPLMQAAFNMLRPTLGLSKAVQLVDRAWNDEFLDGFFALETWGNDNVSFPGECFREYIRAHYRGDELAQGTFHLSGIPTRLEDVRVPLLAVTFEHDTIVPKASALPLVERAGSPDKTHLHLPGGHVGAVVSSAAKRRLWPKLSEFWARNDSS
ncbi:MAG TPA: alpha/beta fold hydrolase [Polyangiaceae bacterium]|nr:alpha/beta fold hydrolase [Polyangiaceae bacterium]